MHPRGDAVLSLAEAELDLAWASLDEPRDGHAVQGADSGLSRRETKPCSSNSGSGLVARKMRATSPKMSMADRDTESAWQVVVVLEAQGEADGVFAAHAGERTFELRLDAGRLEHRRTAARGDDDIYTVVVDLGQWSRSPTW